MTCSGSLMAKVCTVLIFLSAGMVAQADPITIEMVTVGNPGNVGELSGFDAEGFGDGQNRICGAVDYVYEIGKFEITAAQYCVFLNAVAAEDPHNLWMPVMSWQENQGPMIMRSGEAGSYTYSVEPEWANRPVNYLAWVDAARFCNWLHNGQPTGPQGPDTTEDGSYLMSSPYLATRSLPMPRKTNATWVIPSEDEWYKSAYYKGASGSTDYWNYATQTLGSPSHELVEPDPGGHATYHAYPDIYTIGEPYYRTEVGAHENSPGPYGTYDQAGNVCEWTEENMVGCRVVRGGSAFLDYWSLHAGVRRALHVTIKVGQCGLRVVLIPEPLCARLGDVDGNGRVDGDDVPGFVRARLGIAEPGDNTHCADYGTTSLEDDTVLFVADLLGA